MAGREGLPDHLEDALWRVDSARVRPAPAEGLVVCGSGAAERGAELAAEALEGRLSGPIVVAGGDRLPAEAAPGWSVLCASFTGEDAAVLACFEAAGRLGAGRLAVSTGGPLVERAREEGVAVVGLPAIVEADEAVGYYFVAVAEAAALAGLAPRIEPEIRAAAAFLRENAGEADSATARVLLTAMLGEAG